MQQQPPYSPGGTLSTGRYEFTDEENQKIALTGARATFWGYVSIVTGVLALVGLVISLLFKDELVSHGLEPSYVTVFVVALVPIVLTHLVIAMLYIGAGKSLQAVVHTRGNDVEHLMQSLEKLGTAFLVEFAIGMLAVVVSSGIGIQMAIDNVAAEKAAELARAEAEAERIAAAEEDEDDAEDEDDEEDEEGEEDEEEAVSSTDAAEEEPGDTDAEAEEGDTDAEAEEGDTDAAEGDTDAEDAEESEDGEDVEMLDDEQPGSAEEPAAG